MQRHERGMEAFARPQKRRRVLVACSSCRARKTKCDAKKPTCGTCLAAGEACDYTTEGVHTSTKVLIDKEYLRSIEERLESIEKRSVTPSRSLQSIDNSSLVQSNEEPPRPRLDHAPQQTPSLSPMAPSPQDSVIVAADPDVFLGGESGVSFTQLIMNAMNGMVTEKLQTRPFSQQRIDSTMVQTPSQADIYALPSDVSELLDIFFNFHFELSPIFHQPTIRAAFDRIINGDLSYRRANQYTLSIMNMAFAISTSHRRSPTETMARARSFYDTAMSLVRPTLLEDWDIEKVQTLLLGARYLQSSNSPDECWNVLGLAIRIAYGLELHRAPSDDLDFITKETRKRVWYACFGLDKLLSMIYGRPAASSTSTFTTPLPEDLDDDCIQPHRLLYPTPRGPSIMSFSIQVAKLYRVLESAASLYGRGKVTWDTLANTIFSLDEEFEQWKRALPDHLKMHNESGKQDGEQALILALRANMVRILIHRQTLALSLSFLFGSGGEKRGGEGLKTNMFQYSRNICVQTAMDTITLVGLRHEKTADAVGPSWFNLYYLFNAILVIVSHVVDPIYRDDKFALASLDYAMSMINRMSISHACAQRAYFFLQQLLSHMDKSVFLDRHIQNLTVTTQASPVSQQSQPAPSSTSATVSEQNDFQNTYNTDFFALLDVTQGLAENLGSHLESHEAMGSGMWSWMDENATGNTEAITIASSYSVP